MKRSYFLLVGLCCAFLMQAQSAADALRFSTYDVSGTARTIGVGGAIGALGSDFSVVSTNPAGLATYRRSEFTISPSLYSNSTSSTLEDGGARSNTEKKTKFNLSNIGYVVSNEPMNSRSKWTTSNFAIGLNQIANFNRTVFYNGVTEGSYNDRFLELAYDDNGNAILPDNLDQFEAGLAFSTGAIYDPDDDYENGVQWVNDFQLTRDVEVYKEQLINTKGAINELNLSFAGNYNERIMVGASVGLPFVNFSEEKTYVEEDPNDEIPAFEQTTYKESLATSGVGINFKFGLIVRVNQMIRIGAAVHSPTSYTLTDNFSSDLNYIFDQGSGPESFSDESPEGTFEYKLKTPWRYNGSLGVIIQKKGFITGEVEYVRYSSAAFNFTANSTDPGDAAYQDEVNQEITDNFDSVINLKLGAEYVYQMFRFRAGYGIYGTPYAEGININNNAFSLGLGFRQEKFFMDFAFKRLMIDEGYVPYRLADPANEQLINNSVNQDRIVLTLGFKF